MCFEEKGRMLSYSFRRDPYLLHPFVYFYILRENILGRLQDNRFRLKWAKRAQEQNSDQGQGQTQLPQGAVHLGW